MAKEKMTRQEIKERAGDYTRNQYKHGGSRIYIDGPSGNRKLLVDTFYDEDFAQYIDGCTREYFNLPKTD